MSKLRILGVFFLLFVFHTHLGAMNTTRKVPSIKNMPTTSDGKIPSPRRMFLGTASDSPRFSPRPRKTLAIIGVDGMPAHFTYLNETDGKISSESLNGVLRENNIEVFVGVLQTINEIGLVDDDRSLMDFLAQSKASLEIVPSYSQKKYHKFLAKERRKAKAVLFMNNDSAAYKLLAFNALPKMISFARKRNDDFQVNDRIIRIDDLLTMPAIDEDVIEAISLKILARVFNRILPSRQHAPDVYMSDDDQREVLDECKEILRELSRPI